jgi:hypothetical protein
MRRDQQKNRIRRRNGFLGEIDAMKQYLIEWVDRDEKTHFMELDMEKPDELLAGFLVKKKNRRFMKIRKITER